MKNEFELQLGTADVTAITPKVISETIEEIRRSKRVFAQFFRENRDLVGQKGREIAFPIKQAGVVFQSNLAPGDSLDASNITYTAKTIAVQKHGIGLGFYGEAIRQAMRDVIKDAVQEAGEAYADGMDTLALEAMFPTVTITATGGSTVTASGTIVIGVKTMTNASSIIISDTGTSVVFSGAGSLVGWYVPTSAGARRVTATAASLSAKDLLLARGDIIGYNFEPDVLVLPAKMLPDILYDPAVKFVEASAYRGEGAPLTGEIGRLWDMKVILTNRCPRYGAILIDSSNLGYEVTRMDLDLKRDEVTGMRNDMLYFWGFAERAYGVVNNRAYGAVALKGTFVPEANPTL
jgi:hypothetical protein